jgi:pimeloyl-ACP methyl ester carboxylesterase
MSAHFPASATQTVRARDGRTLCFADWGEEAGYPVLFLHGIPGCRLSVRTGTAELVASLGGRLITYDRPGCGRSDRLPGRTIVDCTSDVAMIADALGLDEFAVVGLSCGVPHALAVAAVLGARVSRVGCYAPIAPFHELGAEEWSRGQDEESREYIAACLEGEERAVPLFAAIEEEARAGASPDDPASASVFEQSRNGVLGLVDDECAHLEPWGFDVADVRAPTAIWYDPNDTVTPPQQAEWLVRTIPNAFLKPSDALGHGSTGDPTKDRTALYTWLIHGGATGSGER